MTDEIGPRDQIIAVSAEERDIILAALRLWQKTSLPSNDLLEIAQNGRDFFLDDGEVDDLCEHINCGPKPELVNVAIDIHEQINQFDAECQAAEHTDTDQVWTLMNIWRERLGKELA
jgi:hypothetical protein